MCSFHVQRDAVGSCQRCGHPWCQDCLVSAQGTALCLECLATVRAPATSAPAPAVLVPSGVSVADTGRTAVATPLTAHAVTGPTGTSRDDLVRSIRPSPIFLVIVGVFLASCVWATQADGIGAARWAVRGVVFSGWVLSLCLHEFGHAATAFLGGDHTVAEKGYLTLDPRKYAHVGLSLGLPILFLLLGGIGLPGGAVWINHGLIRSAKMRSLMSFAGPFANLATAALLGVALGTGVFDSWPGLAMGLSFLALLQVSAALLNLLPVPGLDGFGVLSPFLPESVIRSLEPVRQFGFIFLFMLLANTGLGTLLWDTSDRIGEFIGIPLQLAELGRALFSFRR